MEGERERGGVENNQNKLLMKNVSKASNVVCFGQMVLHPSNHFHYTASSDKKLGRDFELGCSSHSRQ